MDVRTNRRLAILLRCGFAASVLAAAGSEPMARGFIEGRQDNPPAFSSLEDEDQRETPLLELDPERGRRTEALLSYKSSVAPYGTVAGIKRPGDRAFTPVSSWKEIEDFIAQTADDRVIVRVLEPWGSEIVMGATVNRKAYPSLVRPADGGGVKAEPKAAPLFAPEKTLPTTAVGSLDSAMAPDALALSASRPNRLGSTSPSSGDPRLIEPKAVSQQLSAAKPSISSLASGPRTGRSTPGTSAILAPRTIEPSVIGPQLAASQPTVSGIASGPRTGRGTQGASALLQPMTIEPGLALSKAGSPSRLAAKSVFPSTPSTAKSGMLTISIKLPQPKKARSASEADASAWLQEAVDYADRLGVLTCKPIITSDRRQRAFAVYTLYMALKELRIEVDLKANRLNSALESLAAKGSPSVNEIENLVTSARGFEQAMAKILQWDVDTMRQVVLAHTAELQAMDSARAMLSYLSEVRRQPKILADIKAVMEASATAP